MMWKQPERLLLLSLHCYLILCPQRLPNFRLLVAKLQVKALASNNRRVAKLASAWMFSFCVPSLSSISAAARSAPLLAFVKSVARFVEAVNIIALLPEEEGTETPRKVSKCRARPAQVVRNFPRLDLCPLPRVLIIICPKVVLPHMTIDW